MKTFNNFFILKFFLLVNFYHFAQPNTDAYILKQLKIEDGLSQSTVYTSLQDHKGFLWFGTRSGLNRYDGYNFLIYLNDPSDSSSISDDGIYSMYEDKQGTLWIGTIGGYLNKFDRSTETFEHIFIADLIEDIPNQTDEFYEYPLSFSRNQSTTVTSIAEDENGVLWIGTWGKGIIKVDKNFKKIEHLFYRSGDKSSLPTNRVTNILFDKDGTKWIATFGGGLSKVDTKNINAKEPERFINYPTGKNIHSLNDGTILKLFEDSQSNIWIGTYYSGLNLIMRDQKNLPPGKMVFTNLRCPASKNITSRNTIMAFAEDKDHFLWIGTFGGGLLKYNYVNNKSTHFFSDPLNPNSLADNDVLSLSMDKSGNIWAGSHLGAGITKIQPNKARFQLIKHQPGDPNSLNDEIVWAVHQDNSDVLWIGTYRGGLNRYDIKTKTYSSFKKQSEKNSIGSNHVRVIKEDNFGNLWIGTYDGGLNLFNKRDRKFKVYLSKKNDYSSIGSDQIQDIFIESDSVYWIGTFGGGLNKVIVKGNPFNADLKFIKYKNDQMNANSLNDNRVYKIFKDKEGIFWIGTYGGGLNRVDPNKEIFSKEIIKSANPKDISINNIMTIAEDSYGMLWIGSYGGSLTCFDKKTKIFKRYSAKEGITSGVIYGIIEDNNKHLWLSSDDGLFKFNLLTKEIKRFDIRDGLQSLEFNGGAYLKNNNGELFFGGINGVNYFHPDSIVINNFMPDVVITSVKILNDPIKGDKKEITLDYRRNVITIEFSSLDFSDPQDNKYAYMLGGLQDEWQYTESSRRFANYTNLSPGTYVFKVRGSNSDGIWNENYTSLQIIILPPFWQRWWFITITIILIGALLYYLSTIRIKNLLAIEKLKSKLAADLHDNVGSGLTEISILSEVAARKHIDGKAESGSELKKISEISRQLVDNMSDIVWVVNPKRDSLHDLIIRLKDSYSETLNSLGISFKTINIDKLKDIKLSMDFKQNLFLIFKEAINNAVKHSGCTKIVLDANFRNDVLEITLNDDGKGFTKDDIRYGDGLKNIEQRAAQINGTIKIRSSIDNGTLIRFIGKLGKINKLKSFLGK